jgi:hypothetical protein
LEVFILALDTSSALALQIVLADWDVCESCWRRSCLADGRWYLTGTTVVILFLARAVNESATSPPTAGVLKVMAEHDTTHRNVS